MQSMSRLRRHLSGIGAIMMSRRWQRLLALVAATAMVSSLTIALHAAAPAGGGDAGKAAAGANTRAVDPVAADALRVRRAIIADDFATAQQITVKVLGQSRIEDWRFYPFTDFMTDIDYVSGTELGKHLDEWVAQDRNAAVPLLLRAHYEYDAGWTIRGHGFASNIPIERAIAFGNYLTKALADVDAAIKLDSGNPYAYLLKLYILRVYGSITATEAAFESARAKFPAYYPLYRTMLATLNPKWGGSIGAMYEFADKSAESASQYSPLKLLYLELYSQLLDVASVKCGVYGTDRDKAGQCVTGVMKEIAKPELKAKVASALQLYDHTDRYQFGLAVREVMFAMLGNYNADADAGAMLQQVASSMHSDTQLKHQGSGHNDYIADELVAASWNIQQFFDNALTKYQQALADAQAGNFPSAAQKDQAIGYIYQQLSNISGNSLHLYEDMIKYEQLAVAHGVDWDEHYICYANYQLRHYDKAIQACTAAIRDTDNDYALYWRGMAYNRAGKSDAALLDFRAEADSDGFFAASSALEMSMIYFDRNDNQAALNVLNRYTFLYDPTKTAAGEVAAAYNNRCYAYMQLGKFEQAFHDCTVSLKYGDIPDAYRKEQELIKRIAQ